MSVELILLDLGPFHEPGLTSPTELFRPHLYWIGLNDRETHDKWVWTDRTHVVSDGA